MEEFDDIKKTKRNRHKTSCLAKTKGGAYNHTCPFCGSENIIRHGIEWCNYCNEEHEVFRPTTEFLFSKPCPNADKHPREYQAKLKRYFRYSQMDSVSVETCVDCGAIHTGVCPNCDKNNHLSKPEDFQYGRSIHQRPRAWKNNFGKIACTRCNFRSK